MYTVRDDIKRVEVCSDPGKRCVVFGRATPDASGNLGSVRVWNESFLDGTMNDLTEEEFYNQKVIPYFDRGFNEFDARKV